MNVIDIAPVIPVSVLEHADDAVPVAQALVAGGIPIIEVTLRSDAALDAIRAIAEEVPEMVVGAGTVCTVDQVKRAVDAGSRFLVSPGGTDRLLDALQDTGLPFLVGTATPSDMLRLLERGITEAKLFPATVVGGMDLLRAVYGPLPQLRFCPTGGISPATAREFLTLPNVGSVGGTWLTPRDVVAARDWSKVELLASEAVGYRG
jgi:2-dehydro-3-deoxyphosphogluconate aldolase/(4S)-4-hydroxy-2-oxoglutarate aldolase